jgi:hypothetical protein
MYDIIKLHVSIIEYDPIGFSSFNINIYIYIIGFGGKFEKRRESFHWRFSDNHLWREPFPLAPSAGGSEKHQGKWVMNRLYRAFFLLMSHE